MTSSWTFERRMIAVGDSPERPMGAMVDHDRSVELVEVYTADRPGTQPADSIFFLMIEGRRYPVTAFHAVKKVHKKGGERGRMEWVVTNDFSDLSGNLQRRGFPASRYPIAKVGVDDGLEVVRDLALEALCFFGLAGDSLRLLDAIEWRASYNGTIRSIDEFV